MFREGFLNMRWIIGSLLGYSYRSVQTYEKLAPKRCQSAQTEVKAVPKEYESAHFYEDPTQVVKTRLKKTWYQKGDYIAFCSITFFILMHDQGLRIQEARTASFEIDII